MAWYQLANFAQSTLLAGISDSASSCAVQSGHGAYFPSAGDFICLIHSADDASVAREFVKVTARTTDTFTIVRQFIDSARFPAIAHSSGDPIGLVIPAEVLEELQTPETVADEAAMLVAADAVGKIMWRTDDAHLWICIST